MLFVGKLFFLSKNWFIAQIGTGKKIYFQGLLGEWKADLKIIVKS